MLFSFSPGLGDGNPAVIASRRADETGYVKPITVAINEVHSLDDVYAVSTYILHRADIVEADAAMDASTLAAVEMPNKDGFIPDPRPDLHNYRQLLPIKENHGRRSPCLGFVKSSTLAERAGTIFFG